MAGQVHDGLGAMACAVRAHGRMAFGRRLNQGERHR